MTRALLLASTLLLAACRDAAAPEQNPVTDTSPTHPGMVAAAHPLAVEAGLATLARGGSAVDAAVSIQAALGLVEPQSSGLGGGAFLMVYDPASGEVWNYDGREEAPSDVDERLFQDADGTPVRYFAGIVSGRSTGTPGAVAMLGMAHSDYGQLPWDVLFEPVIPMAEDGFPVSERLNSLLTRMQGFGSPIADDAEAGPLFFPDGEPVAPGTILQNPAYADTLYALQDNPRAMIEGPIAEAIAAKVAEDPRPGTLSVADMARYQPVKREALCSFYRSHRVCGARPPASGGVAVQLALGLLEPFDMSALGETPEGWHVFIEASRLAYADRDAFVSDAATMPFPVEALLDPAYVAERSALISRDSVIESATPGNPLGARAATDATPDSPGTSHFTVVDADGLTVSMTTTVESAFGSQRMAEGFFLNNQLTDFSFRSVDDAGTPIPNRVGPGKRPRSSMSPTIVFDPNGKFLFTTGSPGGNSIIAYTLKTIVGILDWGLDAQAATDLPNVIARGDTVSVEKGAIDEATLSALRAMGHTIDDSRGEISGIHIIHRLPDGSLSGAADPRRDGIVGEASPL